MDKSTIAGDTDEDGSKYLTFTIGEVCYGLDIRGVTEIVGLQSITPVPELPEYVKGVINLRGKVIPVMDVRARFKLKTQAYHDRTCIIVAEVNGASVGLVVDAVSEVLSIPDHDIEAPPTAGFTTDSRCISGLGKVGDDVKLILDAKLLVNVNEIVNVDDVSVAKAS
jgi:purine-binding chemotaxis protein CheW